MASGQLYRFNIINCEKSNSQFNYGMQPVVYSEREALQGRPGWTRAGTKVTYYKNNFYSECGEDEGKEGLGEGGKSWRGYYTLSFSLSFPHTDDTCYLAYHYPYSFSMLMVGRSLVYIQPHMTYTLYIHVCAYMTVHLYMFSTL